MGSQTLKLIIWKIKTIQTISRKKSISLINFNYFATIGIKQLLYPYVVAPDLFTFGLMSFNLILRYRIQIFFSSLHVLSITSTKPLNGVFGDTPSA